ncbi:hypothetical protein [Nonomuraea roseoviolacea]|uniref:Uncharacterized protein n=1 Tax=Nonomuraea roseoviolacea subsp. carminata TaxID=160689 RepID=A0ABT1KCQ5_9ACTN|nr:hypothetical protein [Nonomuraea roseoviolacea]MCP2351447.1 hypothetical protein [Nonomuraea roseoviolacea subsp. carminata]
MTGHPVTEDLFALAEEALPGVRRRDGGQMRGAALRPQTTVFGDDALPRAHGAS